MKFNLTLENTAGLTYRMHSRWTIIDQHLQLHVAGCNLEGDISYYSLIKSVMRGIQNGFLTALTLNDKIEYGVVGPYNRQYT